VPKPGDWNLNPEKWPIIFVGQAVTRSVGMSLQDCQELEKFGLEALRPQRQKALFFHGGHSDHQNRMAETLVCAFRLAPGFYPTDCDFDQLFPPPEEDKAYKCLLEFGGEEPYARGALCKPWRQAGAAVSLTDCVRDLRATRGPPRLLTAKLLAEYPRAFREGFQQ
jgi:hypothetical protein